MRFLRAPAENTVRNSSIGMLEKREPPLAVSEAIYPRPPGDSSLMREWGEGHLRESSPPRLPMRRAPMEEMQSTHVRGRRAQSPQQLALQIRFGGSYHRPSFLPSRPVGLTLVRARPPPQTRDRRREPYRSRNRPPRQNRRHAKRTTTEPYAHEGTACRHRCSTFPLPSCP